MPKYPSKDFEMGLYVGTYAMQNFGSSLVAGVPAPWPALVSIQIKIGLLHDWAACNAAANLKLWAG